MTDRWADVFDRYRPVVGQGSLVEAQFHRYLSGRCPKIADPEIRGFWTSSPEESWVDLTEQDSERLCMMPTPGTPFAGPDFNSGFPHASRMRASVVAALGRMVGFLDELAPAFGKAPESVSIRVFEGFRDLDTQARLFHEQVDRIRAENPGMATADAESEASRWISPVKNNVPVHSTGLAVDIRLWHQPADAYIDLGVFGVIWETNPGAPTFSENTSPRQKVNRFYCLLAAERAGLLNYPFEFWHFSVDDAYSRWFQKNTHLDR